MNGGGITLSLENFIGMKTWLYIYIYIYKQQNIGFSK
jgi:hypothetical protein